MFVCIVHTDAHGCRVYIDVVTLSFLIYTASVRVGPEARGFGGLTAEVRIPHFLDAEERVVLSLVGRTPGDAAVLVQGLLPALRAAGAGGEMEQGKEEGGGAGTAAVEAEEEEMGQEEEDGGQGDRWGDSSDDDDDDGGRGPRPQRRRRRRPRPSSPSSQQQQQRKMRLIPARSFYKQAPGTILGGEID